MASDISGLSLTELKKYSEVAKVPTSSDKQIALKTWVTTGRDLIERGTTEGRLGKTEREYVDLRKAANIALFLQTMHPERDKPDQRKILSDYLQTTLKYTSKIRDLEAILKERDAHIANARPPAPSRSASGSSTTSSRQPYRESLESTQEPGGNLSVKERIARLNNAGMDVKPASTTRVSRDLSAEGGISTAKIQPTIDTGLLSPSVVGGGPSYQTMNFSLPSVTSPAAELVSLNLGHSSNGQNVVLSRSASGGSETNSISQSPKLDTLQEGSLTPTMSPTFKLSPRQQQVSFTTSPSLTNPPSLPPTSSKPPFRAQYQAHKPSPSLPTFPTSAAPKGGHSPHSNGLGLVNEGNGPILSHTERMAGIKNEYTSSESSLPSMPPNPPKVERADSFSMHFPSISEFEDSIPAPQSSSNGNGFPAIHEDEIDEVQDRFPELPSVPLARPGPPSSSSSRQQQSPLGPPPSSFNEILRPASTPIPDTPRSEQNSPQPSPQNTGGSYFSSQNTGGSGGGGALDSAGRFGTSYSSSGSKTQESVANGSLGLIPSDGKTWGSASTSLPIQNGSTAPGVSPSPSTVNLPAATSAPSKSFQLPIENSITPFVLNSYFSKPDITILLLDVRTQDEYSRGYVGDGSVDCVRIDPSLAAESKTSTEIEASLGPSKLLFAKRNLYELIVVYDKSSTYSSPEAWKVRNLITAIHEREFTKTLKRLPVLLIGGYDAWLRRDDVSVKSPPMSIQIHDNSSSGTSRHHHSSSHSHHRRKESLSSSREPPAIPLATKPKPILYPAANGYDNNGIADQLKRSRRQEHVYIPSPTSPMGASFARGSIDSVQSGYTPSNQHTPQPHIPSSTTHSRASSGSFSYFENHHASSSSALPHSSSRYQLPLGSSPEGVISPPPASLPTHSPLSRRRSDYVDQAGQAYSGYAQSMASSRASIDYPDLKQHGAPQPPPAAAAPALQRNDSRGSLVRSSSLSSIQPGNETALHEVRYWGSDIVGLSGLKNLGNTCYQNSTLQCLSATVPFAQFFKDGRWRKAVNMNNALGTKGNLAAAFSTLIVAMWSQDYDFLSPISFRKSIAKFQPAFAGTEQHDSQEFLAFLLDGLHEDLNRVQVRPPPVPMTPEREAELNVLPIAVASQKEWNIYRMRNDSLIVDWFQGQYRSKMECQTCHQTSTTYDSFMYLSLPVPPGSSKSKVTLEACLNEFTKTELLEKDEAWNCPRCKKARSATKRLSIARVPPVLLIHLKRFSSKNGVFWDKAETLVDFPIRNLDLTNYLPGPVLTEKEISQLPPDDPRVQIPPYRYELYGVSNHMGSLSSGHYTAFVKTSSKQWKYCDDRSVSKAEEREVMSRNAYILFYRRIPESQTKQPAL